MAGNAGVSTEIQVYIDIGQYVSTKTVAEICISYLEAQETDTSKCRNRGKDNQVRRGASRKMWKKASEINMLFK
jgi:hypothetical protein